MNPIENIFSIIKETLHADALSKNIIKENFEEYSKAVKETLHSIPLETVKKNHRIHAEPNKNDCSGERKMHKVLI